MVRRTMVSRYLKALHETVKDSSDLQISLACNPTAFGDGPGVGEICVAIYQPVY